MIVIVSIHTGIQTKPKELVHSSSPCHHDVIISDKDDDNTEGALPHDDGMSYFMWYMCIRYIHIVYCHKRLYKYKTDRETIILSTYMYYKGLEIMTRIRFEETASTSHLKI